MKKHIFSISLAFIACSLPASAKQASCGSTHVRVMTSNLTTGKAQSYDGGEGARILKGLQPDIVLMQEFNFGNKDGSDIPRFVLETFTKGFGFYREADLTDEIPNGIISRFPILQSGEWDDATQTNRDFAWAEIDLPGDGNPNLWAISVHIATKLDKRKLAAKALVDLIRKNVPPTDYLVLGGDLNAKKQGEKEDPAVVTLLGSDDPSTSPLLVENAAPVDSEGNPATNATGKWKYDWVLTNPSLAALQVPVSFPNPTASDEVLVEGKTLYSNGLVFRSNTFPALDRVSPVVAGDSLAENMQHSAVVKDFEIPTGAKTEVIAP